MMELVLGNLIELIDQQPNRTASSKRFDVSRADYWNYGSLVACSSFISAARTSSYQSLLTIRAMQGY